MEDAEGDFDYFDHCGDQDAGGEDDEMILKCGYPGCCMPGYHFRNECHNAEDLEAFEREIMEDIDS
jgi:hypothetical protein